MAFAFLLVMGCSGAGASRGVLVAASRQDAGGNDATSAVQDAPAAPPYDGPEYCEALVTPAGQGAGSCMPIPQPCAKDPTCTCLYSHSLAPMNTCSVEDGGLWVLLPQ
jgi:hypothetical protein